MHVCDFCGKDQTQVKKMIVEKDVAICEECILICAEILIKEIKEDYKEIEFKNETKQNEVK